MAFAQHATFKSFDEFEEALHKYEDEKYAVFVRKSSKDINSWNAANPNKTPFNPCLKFKYALYECGYGKIRPTESTGQRSNQGSTKLDCPVYFRINAEKGNPHVLRITQFHVAHENHPCDKNFIKFHCKRRCLDAKEKENVAIMVEGEGKPMAIRDNIRRTTGKAVTAKDLDNLKRTLKRQKWKGATELDDVVGELENMLVNDKGSYSCIGYGDDGTIDYLFFQTSQMRENLKKYPEIVGMDTTYKVNKNNMHLAVTEVIDNYKNGRVVSYCFMRRETGDVVKESLKIFADANPDACKNIKTIIVDKDYKEINGIREVLPHVQVHLCHTHVMRQFWRHTTKEPKREELRTILRSMSECASKDEFNVMYNDMKSKASDTFIKYFDENWKDCREAWILFIRNQSLRLSIRSTNHNESHNAKIKSVTRRSMTLGECIRALLLLHRDREFESDFKDYKEIASRRYIANCEDEDVADFMQHLSRWAAEELYSEWREAQKLSDDFDDINDDEDVVYSCNCSFFLKFPFNHCQHTIKRCQMKGISALNSDIIPKRFLKPYTTLRGTVGGNKDQDGEAGDTVQESSFELLRRPGPKATKKPQSESERYRMAMKTASDIASRASLTGGKQFDSRMVVLNEILNLWDSGKEVTVLPLRSDGTIDLDVPVVNLEPQSQPNNHTENFGNEGTDCEDEQTDGHEADEIPVSPCCRACKTTLIRRVVLTDNLGNKDRYFWACPKCSKGFTWYECPICESINVRIGHNCEGNRSKSGTEHPESGESDDSIKVTQNVGLSGDNDCGIPSPANSSHTRARTNSASIISESGSSGGSQSNLSRSFKEGDDGKEEDLFAEEEDLFAEEEDLFAEEEDLFADCDEGYKLDTPCPAESSSARSRPNSELTEPENDSPAGSHGLSKKSLTEGDDGQIAGKSADTDEDPDHDIQSLTKSSPTRERTNSAPTISESASPPEINFDMGIDDLIDNIFNDEDKTTKANEKLDKLQYPAGKLHVSDDVLARVEKIAARCEQNHLPPAGPSGNPKAEMRFRSGIAISSSDVETVGEGKWRVKAQTANCTYTVNQKRKECSKCDTGAQLCPHIYICDCSDRFNPCKHIYKIYAMQNPQINHNIPTSPVATPSAVECRRKRLDLSLENLSTCRRDLKLPPAQLVKGKPSKHVFKKVQAKETKKKKKSIESESEDDQNELEASEDDPAKISQTKEVLPWNNNVSSFPSALKPQYKCKGLTVTKFDFETLREGAQLSDTIIDAFLMLMEEEINNDWVEVFIIPSSALLNISFGMDAYLTGIEESQLIFNDIIIAPSHLIGNHWILFVVFVKAKQIYIINSLGSKPNKAIKEHLQILRYQMSCSHLYCTGEAIKWNEWSVVSPQDCPQQTGNDCGVIVCLFIYSIMKGALLNNREFQLPATLQFRKWFSTYLLNHSKEETPKTRVQPVEQVPERAATVYGEAKKAIENGTLKVNRVWRREGEIHIQQIQKVPTLSYCASFLSRAFNATDKKCGATSGCRIKGENMMHLCEICREWFHLSCIGDQRPRPQRNSPYICVLHQLVKTKIGRNIQKPLRQRLSIG